MPPSKSPATCGLSPLRAAGAQTIYHSPEALGKALLPGHVVLQIRGLRRNHPRNDLEETALPLQFFA